MQEFNYVCFTNHLCILDKLDRTKPSNHTGYQLTQDGSTNEVVVSLFPPFLEENFSMESVPDEDELLDMVVGSLKKLGWKIGLISAN